MKFAAEMYTNQYRAVEDALEAWRLDHDEAMCVYDIEEAIGTTLGLHARTQAIVGRAWEAGFSGTVRSSQDVGSVILALLKVGVKVWLAIARGVEACSRAGYTVDRAEEVQTTLTEIRALAADFERRWPFCRTEDIERGHREIAAGRFFTGEELLGELQGKAG